MRICSNCHTEILDQDTVFCPVCGKEIQDEAEASEASEASKVREVNPNDRPSVIWNILGFIFPLMGFVLAIIWRKTMPVRAKSIATAAVVGQIVGIIANLLVK